MWLKISSSVSSSCNCFISTFSFLILHLPPEMPSSVQLLATPDYPVAAGQRVSLHCSASHIRASIIWTWQREVNQSWQTVGNGTDLILTEPEQSGLYRCCGMRWMSLVASNSHAVYIVSMHATGWWHVVNSCISKSRECEMFRFAQWGVRFCF